MKSVLTVLFRTGAIAAAIIGWSTVAVGDCTLTTTGMTPVNDLGVRSYKGFPGGLYPNGINNPPPAHLAAGMDRATNLVKPRNSAGVVDLANGKIVLISVGMSNTTQEFSQFVSLANADPSKNPQLVIVDGAQGGQDASTWV